MKRVFIIVGIFVGHLSFCCGGKEDSADFCSWFLEQHPKETVSQEIAPHVYATIETLDKTECLYALSYWEFSKISEKRAFAIWMLEAIDESEYDFLLFARTIICATGYFYRLRNLTSEIDCPEDGKIKVCNLLCRIFYADESLQRLQDRLSVLMLDYEEILKRDLFIHCYLCLKDSEILYVRDHLNAKLAEIAPQVVEEPY